MKLSLSVAIREILSVECKLTSVAEDCQNMTSPNTLFEAFKSKSYLHPVLRTLLTIVISALPDVGLDYSQMIYHVNIHALHDLMVFIHNIPIMLNSHPKVRCR